ncbi:MAG: regulatory protein RecX [Gammaproteobacteria bacterium]|nr:regulatory protein RecX [Gammaproteobacteria bacterium]MCP5199207.1 regulatory protein RecX [Gammaproteobacteria bacterium]
MSDEDPLAAAERAAVAALARREHSRRELERKLGARGLDAAAVGSALDALGAAGLQDDGRFAAAYARQRAERGYGPRRIRLELRERGIEATAIEAAFGEVERDFATLAREVQRRKFGHVPRSLAERAKQTRFLEYRGFEAAQIRHALEHDVDDDEDF